MTEPPDRGFVTVAVAGLLLVLLAVMSLVAALGAVAVVRHRAAAAADLAALAAATHALEGPSAACRIARRIAQQQGGRLTSCSLDGLDAWVRVAVRPSGPLGRYGEATATSHAGPHR